MKTIFRQTQLYKFLQYCEEYKVEKSILDCGAGGDCPPLAIFRKHDYETFGIEIDERQLDKAILFAKKKGITLNVMKGDMREIPFENEFFGCIYSYGAIFHMKKAEICKAIVEIKRVLKPGGLCFVNFLSVNDFRYDTGEKIGEGQYLQEEEGETVIHSYYHVDEGDKHFEEMEFVYKENRVLERMYKGHKIRQGYIDYIVRKT
jgi:SAM-dependent methyltransferase